MSADLFYLAAVERFQSGDSHSSRDVARAGLEVDPEHGHLHQILGLAEYHLENLSAAVFHFEYASANVRLDVGPQLALADSYLKFGQVPPADAIYRFLSETGRCPLPLLAEVARGLGRVGADDLALGVCQRLTRLRPGQHSAWYGVAFHLGRLNRPPAEMLSPLRTALDLAPNVVHYRVSLTLAYASVGLLDEAGELVATIDPESVRCACQCRELMELCERIDRTDLASRFRPRP